MATVKDMELFGEVDRDVRGRIASEYPAWYFETHIENLKEERASLIRRIERGEIPPDGRPYAESEARNMKERIEHIESSRPELSGDERDKLHKLHRQFSNKISDSMFTRSEMMMGTASAHEEAKRMVQKLIGLSPEQQAFAKTCNVNPEGGKISRNDATRVWKILGRLIGEGTNVEGLRKDRATTLTGI